MNNLKSNCCELNIIKKRIIKILLKESKNQECFECSTLCPEYISLNNGIFICKNCVKNHLKLPNKYSNVIKNNLNNLNLKNIQYLSCGGNRKLYEFITIEYPNLKKYEPFHFYQTYAMDYYRKYLEYLIEGGIKPIKPNIEMAYELIPDAKANNNYNLNNNENEPTIDDSRLIQSKKNLMIKTDSFIKINKNGIIYPKIKPIVGTKNEYRFSQSLSRFNNLDLGYNNNHDFYLTTSNFNNLNNLNNSLKDIPRSGKLSASSSSTDFKNKYYNNINNYDVDYDEINDIMNNKDKNEQINDLSDINEISDLNKLSLKINKHNSKLKSKIVKRNKENTNIKVLNIGNTTNNNNNSINNFSAKPSIQNHLISFQNNNNNNINIENKNNYKNSFRNKNKNILIDIFNNKYNIKNKKDGNGKQIISSIEDLRNYLNNHKDKQMDNFIINLNIKSNKNLLTENSNSTTYLKGQNQNRDLNNINNNIIINKNLNLFYNNNNNNNNLQKIFKKKKIRNSFSINENIQKIPKSNNSLDKMKNYSTFMEPNELDKIYKIKKKIKNEWKRKITNKIAEKNKENAFIKVNKINNQLKVSNNKNKNKIISDINNNFNNNNNNYTCGNIFLNYKNNNINDKNNNKYLKYIINNTFEEKTKIAHRISRIITTNKENNEIINPINIIRVNQKENNIKKYNRNIYDINYNYNYNDIKSNFNSNSNYIGVKTVKQKREQKEKDKNEKYKNFNNVNNHIGKKKIRITKSYNNILDRKKRSLLLMKDLINLPLGKKRYFLEIIKTNNLLSRSVSPSSKRILQNLTDPNIYPNNKRNNSNNSIHI